MHQAAQSIAAGCEDIQIAGGVEHMQHIPMEAGFDPSPRFFYRHSPAMMNMGLTAENLARKYRISRQAAGRVRLAQPSACRPGDRSGRISPERSFRPGATTTQGGSTLLTQDECIRRDTSLEAWPR